MALVYDVKITCPEATGIRCKFTGRPMQVVAHVCEGVVTYSVPDAFTLYTPQESLETLLARASMRDGVGHSVEGDDVYVDPYSGRRMEVRKTTDGRFYLAGGFDPTCSTMSLSALVEGLTGRSFGLAPAATSVEHPGDMDPDDSDLAHKQVEELTEAAGEKMAKVIPGATHGRVTVSVSRKSQKGKKGK